MTISTSAPIRIRAEIGHNRSGAYYVKGLQDSIVLTTMHTCPGSPGNWFAGKLRFPLVLPTPPQSGGCISPPGRRPRVWDWTGAHWLPATAWPASHARRRGEGELENQEVPTGTDWGRLPTDSWQGLVDREGRPAGRGPPSREPRAGGG